MILIDTSAWVEFLRATGSEADASVDRMLRGAELLATTDVVVMEVLAGARDHQHLQRLRGLLARCEFVATDGPRDYEDAAGLYVRCRRAGEIVRRLTDCLIAAVAIRTGCELVHSDADFAVLARHAPLSLA